MRLNILRIYKLTHLKYVIPRGLRGQRKSSLTFTVLFLLLRQGKEFVLAISKITIFTSLIYRTRKRRNGLRTLCRVKTPTDTLRRDGFFVILTSCKARALNS